MATKNKTVDYYMNLPYTVEVKHDEDGYFAKVLELPGCMTWANSLEELDPMIEDAKRGWIEDALEHGDPIPEPRDVQDYSGKVNLRMPKSLHRDLTRRADEEGVSLNQLMVSILSRAMGRTPTIEGRVSSTAGRVTSVRIALDDFMQRVEKTFLEAVEEAEAASREQAAKHGAGTD